MTTSNMTEWIRLPGEEGRRVDAEGFTYSRYARYGAIDHQLHGHGAAPLACRLAVAFTVDGETAEAWREFDAGDTRGADLWAAEEESAREAIRALVAQGPPPNLRQMRANG